MPIRVQVAGHGIVEFPNNTSEDVMRKALSTLTEGPKTPLLMRQPNEGITHEPETYWGGFGKSVLDQVLGGGQDNPIRRAANPQGVGDMAGLLLPGAIGENIPSIKELGSRSLLAMKAAGKETTGLKGAATFPVRAAHKFADSLPSANEAAIAKFKGAPGATAPPAASATAPISDPIAGALDAARAKRAAPAGVRLAGKAPTLEEELQKAVEGARQPTDPRITSMAPEQGITPGGPTRQSGGFRKSEAVGKPGGYSSGNPGTTQVESSLKDMEHQKLLEKFGGRGPETAAPGAEAPSAMPEPVLEDPIPEIGATEKPKLSWKEAVDNLQTRVGARDAARAVGGKPAGITPEDIRALTGKRGQLPTEAQDRILEEQLRRALENDE